MHCHDDESGGCLLKFFTIVLSWRYESGSGLLKLFLLLNCYGDMRRWSVFCLPKSVCQQVSLKACKPFGSSLRTDGCGDNVFYMADATFPIYI